MKKMFISLAALFLLSAGYAAAQELTGIAAAPRPVTTSDLTGFKATLGPGVNPATVNAPPNPNVVLKPEFHGAIIDGVKYGTVMISPAAPAAYGKGEKYLAAPSSEKDLQNEAGPAAHRPTGGLKLFTF